MSELHSREVAVDMLNKFYDSRGVLDEDRVQVDLLPEEVEAMAYMSESEKADVIEKSDVLRELVIKALRKKIVWLNEETMQLEYKLEAPPMGKDGLPIVDIIKFVGRYPGSAMINNTIGVKAKDETKRGYAYVACRCGISRLLFEQFMDDDIMMCQAIAAIYSRK